MLAVARRIFRFRSLLWTLTVRELKARYRGSLLGFFWSLANPLLLLAVYSLVFGYIFDPGRSGGAEPYALFLVTGLFPWIWVSSSLLEGTTSLVVQSALIRKAVFPAELLPMISVLSNGVHFLFALPVLGAALVAGRLMGYPVGGWSALLLPLVVLLQIPLISGLSLGISALNVHFKDVRDIVSNLLTLLFFLTPILYPLSIIEVEALRRLILANPFTPYALAYQRMLFQGVVPEPWIWGAMLIFSTLAWVLGAGLFERLRETLVEAV